MAVEFHGLGSNADSLIQWVISDKGQNLSFRICKMGITIRPHSVAHCSTCKGFWTDTWHIAHALFTLTADV